MDTTVRTTSRLLGSLVACAGAALGIAALSVFFGGSSAHAAERPTGLLDPLISTIDSVTSPVTTTVGDLVTGTVDDVVTPLVQVLAPVGPSVTAPAAATLETTVDPLVEVVASLPVVGPPTATAVSGTVNSAVTGVAAVSELATSLLGDDPVDRLTQPLLSTLHELPVAGDLVRVLDPILAPGIDGVDSILGSLGETVTVVIDPVAGIEVIDPSIPAQPVGPAVPDPSDSSGDPPGISRDDPVSPGEPLAEARAPAPPPLAQTRSGPVAISEAASGPASAPGDADPLAVPPVSSSPISPTAGSGGGSGGTAATVADAAPLSPRAWECANGASDDALPPAPVFDTDASPD